VICSIIIYFIYFLFLFIFYFCAARA